MSGGSGSSPSGTHTSTSVWPASYTDQFLLCPYYFVFVLSEDHLSLGDSAGQIAQRETHGFDWIVEVLRTAYLKFRKNRGPTDTEANRLQQQQHFSLTFAQLRQLYAEKYDLLELKPSEFGAADSSDLLQRLSKHKVISVVR